jgi:hypothetical protein
MVAVSTPKAYTPKIRLDTTLEELYRRSSSTEVASKRIGQVLCGVNSGMGLSEHFPRNSKYLYQDSAFNQVPAEKFSASRNKGLQRSLAVKYLGLIPQRDAFISGRGPVILFQATPNTTDNESGESHEVREARRTLSVLEDSQTPDLVFCAGPSQIPVQDNAIDTLAYKLALDDLERYPLAVSLDTHWFVNSKAALARSGLPTPKSQVIDITGCADSAEACCGSCKGTMSSPGLGIIPRDCSGSRGRWIEEEIKSVVDAVEAHEMPFVFKNQQTYGGAGTWIVRSEEERKDLLHDLLEGGAQDAESGPGSSILRKLLSQVTNENQHLSPASAVISHLVEKPIGDFGLTFFIHDEAETPPLFLGVSSQMIADGSNAWIGSSIDYSSQESLKNKFSALVERTATWLQNQSYYGPVGMDVLETTEEGETESMTGEKTKYHIVDLNVRTSGSLCLPLLRGHFTSRGLYHASSLSIAVDSTREEFIDQWSEDIGSGRMCILSWYEDPSDKSSVADVVLGATDARGLQEMQERLRAGTNEVTF